MTNLLILLLLLRLVCAFEPLTYCTDTVPINFRESCLKSQSELCYSLKNELLTYINHNDFFFRIGN